ncbi:MAG: DoxX family protein [Rhodanobacter sp.]
MTSTARKPFFWIEFAPFLLSILRIVSGLLFMQHGAQKLFGMLGHAQVPLLSLMGAAGVLEFFGGLLIVLGLLTRPTAFILSGQMAFAYFLVHNPANAWPVLNGGDLAVLFCFFFLYLSAAGAGPWSLDRLMHRN